MAKKKQPATPERAEKADKVYAVVDKEYKQKSISKRIEALFLDHIGEIITSEQIIQVSIDPETGKTPENWHQRLSELRTDAGYTILSWRNRGWLRVQEYLMPSAEKRIEIGKRVYPSPETWKFVLERAHDACEWSEGSSMCGLKNGDIDPVGGGKVQLTPDHKTPHSVHADTDIKDPQKWQALCGRHQVMKKNYWDNNTGKMNIYAIIQSATKVEKTIAFKFLLDYFSYVMEDNGDISKLNKK